MDYEKRLKKALEDRATERGVVQWIEENFPELKESEDERMIKFIKNQLYNIKKTITENYELDAKLTKAIDWLEKQGEHKSADNIPQDFEKYVEHLLSLSDGEGHSSPAKVKEVSAELFKLAQLEWSEEDETNLRRTEYAVMKFFGGDCSLVGWLRKSLRPRNDWKPSKEQIIALRWVLNNVPYNKYKEEISGLLDQIKDL